MRAIALSHPHFLGACIDISKEFEAPIYMSEKDKEWIGRPGEQYHLFSGANALSTPTLASQ